MDILCAFKNLNTLFTFAHNQDNAFLKLKHYTPDFKKTHTHQF